MGDAHMEYGRQFTEFELREYLASRETEVEGIMRTLFDQDRQTEIYGKEQRDKGRTEGMLASIRSLMDTMKISADKAMALLKIPASEYPIYQSML